MKDIDDGAGNKEDRVKIIRTSSIGDFAWDTTDSTINKGYGVNEWSQADLMKLLNPGYESESVGGSLYWNSGAGTCYSGSNNKTTSCDFTSTGIKEKLKTLISDAVWNTGTNSAGSSSTLAKERYLSERSTTNGKICSSSSECNDTVVRTTEWVGKIGLMYPSDYGYAVGGSTANREECLNISLPEWNQTWAKYCRLNDWLYYGTNQWTLSPGLAAENGSWNFYIYRGGSANANYVSAKNGVIPTAFLLADTKIISGDGSSSSPFVLSN